MFSINNSTRPNRAFLAAKWKEMMYRLGFEDYNLYYYFGFPLILGGLYQIVSMYMLYGEKGIFICLINLIN